MFIPHGCEGITPDDDDRAPYVAPAPLPQPFRPRAGDLRLAAQCGGRLPCNGCDALTPVGELLSGCYCRACWVE